MSFRELIEALSPDEIEKITGRKPKSGVHTQSIKPEHRANGQATVAKGEPDDGSKGYGKRRYMGDDVESAAPNLEEGDVNYAKMHTQANPKYASGTKWRKSSAAVKAKPDDVGAGELGAHNGGSGHVAVKATMNQRDKLADRQEINARGHKTFAIKQTRLPRTSVRKPLPEGLEYMPGEFRELVEAQLNEISRSLASSYISGAKSDERKDRSSGIKLAQKKKWGDAKFGFDEPKVKATSEEVVSEAAAGHYHSLAEDAIDNATGFSPKHDEYHKWMTVHHKAMRAHYEQQGNHRMAESHDAVAEHHAGHVADDDFHNGESHHWSGF
jgi:hypothetical protein